MALSETVTVFVLGLAGGFLGVTGAAIVRNCILVRLGSWGSGDSGIPGLIVVFSLVASIAGSLAAEDIGESILHLPPAMIGGFAGLLSAILMVMLMTAYHMSPDKSRNSATTAELRR